MKIFITSYNKVNNYHVGLVVPNLDYQNPKFIKIDFFVGCCFSFPSEFLEQDIDNLYNKMIGNIYEINDDTLQNKGIYIPGEKDLIL